MVRWLRAFGAMLLIAACSDVPASGEALDAGAADGGVLYAQLTLQLKQIRPRVTVDPDTARANVLDAVTSWWPVEGEARLRTTPDGVDLAVALRSCRTFYSYPIRVYDGSDCGALTADSQTWDGARGELELNALCLGSPGAQLYYARASSGPQAWTLGGPAKSNLVGRTIAVLDPDTLEPLACGAIRLTPDATPAELSSQQQRPRDDVVLQLAGVCLLDSVSSALPRAEDAPRCPDRPKLVECALQHCVAHCLDVCAEHTACLEATSDACASDCPPSAECTMCLGASRCTLGFCEDELACAPPPTPGGPCTELRECCMRQGPLVNSCLEYAKLLERLSGDPSCLGALYDVDVNENFVYRSPCYPDGGAPME